MRFRFFWIISVVLIVVAFGSSIIQEFYLYQERLRLIDQQVRETASTLLSSQLAELTRVDIEQAEDIISDELGENRIGKFFVLKDNERGILYESTSAKVLPVIEIPSHPQWISIRTRGQFIRILNLDLPRIPERSLQVGLVIDEQLLSANYFSRSTLNYAGTVLLIGLAVSFLLTSQLLVPVKQLAVTLHNRTKRASAASEIPPISNQELGLRGATRFSEDEFTELLNGLNHLILEVNKGYRLSKFWSYQMAHELKTPLAIMDTEVELALKSGEIQSETAALVREEISRMTEIVTLFLSWAEIENQAGKQISHSVRVSHLLTALEQRLSKRFPGRLKVTIPPGQDFNVIANLQHAEQFFSNLLVNALLYSPEDSVVEVCVEGKVLKIADRGPGIPGDCTISEANSSA